MDKRISSFPQIPRKIRTMHRHHRYKTIVEQVPREAVKAVVKYVGGFWPIGVFFAGYRSFFFVPSRQTQTKARL